MYCEKCGCEIHPEEVYQFTLEDCDPIIYCKECANYEVLVATEDCVEYDCVRVPYEG